MSLLAKRIFTMKQKLFIPVTQFQGLVPLIHVVKSAPAASSEIGVSADADAFVLETDGIGADRYGGGGVKLGSVGVNGGYKVQLQEISTFGLTGLLMNTANDDVAHFMHVPTDWDRERDIGIRILWTTASSTIADTVTWKFLYNTVEKNATVMAKPATILNTVLVAEVDTATAYIVQRSQTEGVLAGGILTKGSPDYLSFLVEMDAKSGITEDIFLLGVEFEYTVRAGRGHHVANAVDWRV